jgi:hypothetical protein
VKLAAAVLLFAVAAHAADTAEALKVAGWVRALPAAAPDDALFGVLGGISMTSIGPGTQFIRTSGPAAFYDNAAQLAQSVEILRQRAAYLTLLVAGGNAWFRDVQNVPWGMIEVAPGRYQWELLDAAVKSAQSAGGRYVGTVMPYAGWELRAAGYAPSADSQCQRLFTEDFFYLAADQRMDRYKDEAAYVRFLTAAVERYDGDGIDDMPGLTAPVLYWQVHNEPEGASIAAPKRNLCGTCASAARRSRPPAHHARCSTAGPPRRSARRTRRRPSAASTSGATTPPSAARHTST